MQKGLKRMKMRLVDFRLGLEGAQDEDVDMVVVVAAVVVEEEEHLGIRIQLFPDKGKKRISPVERIIIDDSRGLKRSRGEAVWLGDLAENEHDDGYVALCINE